MLSNKNIIDRRMSVLHTVHRDNHLNRTIQGRKEEEKKNVANFSNFTNTLNKQLRIVTL